MMIEAQKKISSRIKAGGVVAVLATSTVGGFEGIRQYAYPDPASGGRPWTICYGETHDVHPGDHKSITECKELLRYRLGVEAEGLDKCITRVTTDGQAVAFLSLAHNIGVGGVCRSSVAKDFNKGNARQACNDLLKFDKAAGITFPGLTRRRVAERRLCLEGVE